MTSWAGFWIGLAVFLSVLTVMDFVEQDAARIWPTPPPIPAPAYDACPYAVGC